MADLEAFRAEIRDWLATNCPPEMREPVRDERDICWGGRNWTFKNDGTKFASSGDPLVVTCPRTADRSLIAWGSP